MTRTVSSRNNWDVRVPCGHDASRRTSMRRFCRREACLPYPRPLKRTLRTFAIISICLCSGARGAQGQSEAIWEMTPYRIHVFVAAADQPELTSRLTTDVVETIAARADAVVGVSWTLDVEPATGELREKILGGLDRLDAAALPAALLDSNFDKIIFERIVMNQGECAIAARELDVRTRLLGTPVASVVFQRQLTPAEAFRAVLLAFAPLSLIDEVNGDNASLRLKAAGLAPRDPRLRQVGKGDVFLPVLRVNDRDGKPKRIQPLDWTLLTVQSVDQSRATAEIHTARRGALAGRRRGRVEQLALGVRPPRLSTRLVLQARGKSKRPLAGYQVFAGAPDSKTTELVGQTDGEGGLLIAPAPGGVRILFVKNGGELLARLPVLPGVAPVLTAAILDDDRRLEVEGLITGMQERFVDLLARRQTLAARVRSRIDAEKWDEAKTLLEELRGLDARPQFEQLQQQRRAIVASDPQVQRKIDRLFNDTQQVVTRFLDPNDVDQLERDLNEAKAHGKSAAVSGS
jgi:hypothetical protein